MTLQPYPDDQGLPTGWQEMGAGAPTLMALASVCAQAIIRGVDADAELSPQALAILYAARDRGMIEVKGLNTEFEAPSRLLAIYVERTEERTVMFRSREDPAITIRFFDGFRQLCGAGLVMHHLYRDFSLTSAGFDRAASIREDQVRGQLDLATEFGLHD